MSEPEKPKQSLLPATEKPSEPFLFDRDQLPACGAVLKSVKDGAYKHTGARLLENDEKALHMVQLLAQGLGLKAIARQLSISKHTVRAARELLVARGELAPYKARVVALFEDIIEQGGSNYLEALEDGLVPAGQIPVGVGIFSDKRALALGEPTSIGASIASPAAQELSVDKLNAWFAGLKSAAIDIQSGENPKKPE